LSCFCFSLINGFYLCSWTCHPDISSSVYLQILVLFLSFLFVWNCLEKVSVRVESHMIPFFLCYHVHFCYSIDCLFEVILCVAMPYTNLSDKKDLVVKNIFSRFFFSCVCAPISTFCYSLKRSQNLDKIIIFTRTLDPLTSCSCCQQQQNWPNFVYTYTIKKVLIWAKLILTTIRKRHDDFTVSYWCQVEWLKCVKTFLNTVKWKKKISGFVSWCFPFVSYIILRWNVCTCIVIASLCDWVWDMLVFADFKIYISLLVDHNLLTQFLAVFAW